MIAPMLSKLREHLPAGGQYIYEVKLDGQRTIAEVSKDKHLLYTRSFQDVTARYPELDVLRKSIRGASAVLDGEIVALKDGVPSFELLQVRMGLQDLRKLPKAMEQAPVLYYVFDILADGKRSLISLPLEERKEILAKVVKPGKLVKILPFFESPDIIEKARDYGYEGVVLKKKNSVYLPGQRTELWIKHKFVQQDTFLICGWLEGKRSRQFGALVLGQEKNGKVVHVGRAGTGFAEKTIAHLLKLFEKYNATQSPFDVTPRFVEKVHWLKPRLLARIKFTEWTNAGILRNPVYLGLATE